MTNTNEGCRQLLEKNYQAISQQCDTLVTIITSWEKEKPLCYTKSNSHLGALHFNLELL